jgi:hypothetical protein
MAANKENQQANERPIIFSNDRITPVYFPLARNHTTEVQITHSLIVDLLGELNIPTVIDNPAS